MARISKDKWQENFAKYNAIILEIFLTEGWDFVTYDRLSKETGLRKSTLQGYYPSNQDFAVAMDGKVLPIIMQHLSFESREALIQSWAESLESQKFRMIMKMFVMHASKHESEGRGALGAKGLLNIIQYELPDEDGLELLQHLFGLTVTGLLGLNK
ncbi:hypothetical protein BIZ37_24245 [Photobacterium sp. BZF1]|nr:hypothetical protein [Photobacterium sp. BZF1]MBC7005673.1 hypothetical protein [Photobacterium sp. BZF1]